MDAAFCLGSAAPTACPRIFIGRGPAGAGHAPDRQKTRRGEWMRRQFCKCVDRFDRFARDVCEWIEFQPDAVLFDHRNIGAQATLKTLASVNPGAERRQSPRQWLTLPPAAAR